VNTTSSLKGHSATFAGARSNVLLGDIGATNARFVELSDGRLSDMTTFKVADFHAFEDVLKAFLDTHRSDFTHALLALAGPVESGRCRLTNTSWTVDPLELSRLFGFEFQILNDFQAVAYSLPLLAPPDLRVMGGGKPLEGAAKAVLGPGSGLGVACFIEAAGGQFVIPSEGGHSTLAGNSDREDAIIHILRERFSHASAERAISGPGLENLFQAIARLDNRHVAAMSAAEITQRALARECEIAAEALSTFCSLLGSFAGNVALTFGARGGVYIAGGISPRIVEFLAHSQFRARFESKGRFRQYLEQIPSSIIVHPAAAFLGLKFLAAQF
jgi:glucokinase